MAVFTYKATDTRAGETSGTIAADTPRQARDLLRQRGLVVKDLAEERGGAAKRAVVTRGRASRYQSTLFIRELSTLLAVGVPLLEALDTIAKQHTGRFNASILLLRDRVAAGSSLANAMREQPDVFDDLCVNITDVGEDAGTLDSSLERLAEFRERSQQLKGRVSTALIYPCIVLATALLATTFLMTFVVPKILEPLVEQGQPLPLPTRIVKGASDFLIAWGWLVLLIVVGAFMAFFAAIRTPTGRMWWHRRILRLPLLGELVRKQAIVRIAIVISTLLKSGIVFIRALEIAQRTTRNQVIRNALDRGGKAISAGEDIAVALDATGAFPPMVVQVFSLGQQSGRLEEMLDRLATNYDQQVNTAANRMTSILEPLLIILLAILVLFIVLATVLPILEAGNAIQ
jgi:type II secretory pathway component PulF